MSANVPAGLLTSMSPEITMLALDLEIDRMARLAQASGDSETAFRFRSMRMALDAARTGYEARLAALRPLSRRERQHRRRLWWINLARRLIGMRPL